MTGASFGQFNTVNMNAHYDKIYENLAQNAHTVKPNEAKAKLVQQNPIQAAASSVKDTFEDAKNVKKAIQTGKVGDNSLGRINDLGLKAGALLIASFLATTAKTKTDAIMQFVGGGAFLASMSLWPKIFINLPARIIHGFPVDRKYISAQGDKKDFGLDNQFIVWDCVPDEILRKDAKRAGIDFDSPNGKEKIQRKEQKTMLQTRTLNLATVGFGAPLMTSLFGNFVEPKVRKAVVNHEVAKVEKIVSGDIKNYLDNAKINASSRKENVKQIEALFEQYNSQNKVLDDEFFKKLASQFDLTEIIDEFRDKDDITPLKQFGTANSIEELKSIYDAQAIVDKNKLQTVLEDFEFKSFDDFFSDVLDDATSKDNTQKVADIMTQLKDNPSINDIKKVLIQNDIADEEIASIINKVKQTKPNTANFESTIVKYSENFFSQMKARLKAYLQLLNPVVGSKAESAYTQEYTETLDNLFKSLGINNQTKALESADIKTARKLLADIFAQKCDGIKHGSEEYQKLIKDITPKELDKFTSSLVNRLSREDYLQLIRIPDIQDADMQALDKAICGQSGSKNGLVNILQEFVRIKTIDLESVKSKALICANFEARVNAGEFANYTKGELELARRLVYDGSAAFRYNHGFVSNVTSYNKVLEQVLNPECFEQEESVFKGIKELVKDLKTKVNIDDDNYVKEMGTYGTQTERYVRASSFADLVKNHATKLQNNKNWLKTFGTMAIILAGATLLIQPFFGKIDKEFPKKDEKRGA